MDPFGTVVTIDPHHRGTGLLIPSSSPLIDDKLLPSSPVTSQCFSSFVTSLFPLPQVPEGMISLSSVRNLSFCEHRKTPRVTSVAQLPEVNSSDLLKFREKLKAKTISFPVSCLAFQELMLLLNLYQGFISTIKQ